MGHLTHAHGTRQAGTALDGVQSAQGFVASLIQRRAPMPAAQCSTELGQQVDGLFLENGKQVGIDLIEHIDIVFVVTGMHRQRDGFIDAALQLGLMLHAARGRHHGIRCLIRGFYHGIQQRVGCRCSHVFLGHILGSITRKLGQGPILRKLGSKVQRQVLGICRRQQRLHLGPLCLIQLGQIGQLEIGSFSCCTGIDRSIQDFTQCVFDSG